MIKICVTLKEAALAAGFNAYYHPERSEFICYEE